MCYPLYMNKVSLSGVALAACVLVAGCNTAAPTNDPVVVTSVESILDQQFTSAKLGISGRYPSVVYVDSCKKNLAVKAQETDSSIDFVMNQKDAKDCFSSDVDLVFNRIYAMRVQNISDVKKFIERVFPSQNCVIDSREVINDDMTAVFLKPTTPSDDLLACGDVPTWNTKAGVIIFSRLGSKNGGGYHWLSEKEMLFPDGSMENGYDFLIWNSIQFLD